MSLGTLSAIAIGGAVAGKAVTGAIAAGKQRKAANEQQQLALDLAAMRPEEMKAFEQTIEENTRVLNREQKLIEAVDPAIMEAGRQAFLQLQGKETAVLGPLRRQRARQKQVLEETLRRRLGPGFETSSAGIEALSKFDVGTSDLLAQTQQQTTTQLLGFSQQASSLARSTEASALGRISGARNLFSNVAARESNAATGTASGVVQSAGGELRSLGGFFGDVAGIGTLAASAKTLGTAAASAGNISPDDFSIVSSGPTFAGSGQVIPGRV